jgi:hypothetical protein
MLFAASCSARTTCAAPALSDAALDAVTAGTAGMAVLAPADGARSAVVVADGAAYTLERRRGVRLEGDAQSGSRGFNVVGAAGSDVGNAVNVLARGTDLAGGALQQNLLLQRENGTAWLGRANLAGRHLVQRASVESGFASGGSRTALTGWHVETRSRTRSVDQYSAFVPEYNPLENLTLSVGTPALDPLYIPAFRFDFVEETEAGDYGIRGGVGPFTLGAPQLVLGTVSLEGNDVVLSAGYVQLPSLDLGSASLEVCIAECVGGSVDLGGFEGGRVDFPGGDLRFEGANPFKDVRINAGHGIAATGAGSISVVLGRVTLAASLQLDLPDPRFSFDFTIPEFAGIGPWDVNGPDITVEIPALSVSHTLIDEPVGFAFSATFDGVLCLPASTADCSASSRHTEHESSEIVEELRTASASSFSAASRTASGATVMHAGATLTDAEADLLAMSQASALIDSTSSIALADGAQRGLRAVNAVNAADTIVGNAVNVTAIRSPGISAAEVRGSLGQANTFVQYRTRYGP